MNTPSVPTLTGFGIWSASFHSDGRSCSENQSFCRCEGYKPGQTVRHNMLLLRHETSYCCPQWNWYGIPTDVFTDSGLFFFALLMFILSLCYYFPRAPVYSGESLDLSFSHVQLDPIPHLISQFCPSAGGTSWWTTVTQPPPGILMMNSAMTFSFGNLSFCSFFEMLTR